MVTINKSIQKQWCPAILNHGYYENMVKFDCKSHSGVLLPPSCGKVSLSRLQWAIILVWSFSLFVLSLHISVRSYVFEVIGRIFIKKYLWDFMISKWCTQTPDLYLLNKLVYASLLINKYRIVVRLGPYLCSDSQTLINSLWGCVLYYLVSSWYEMSVLTQCLWFLIIIAISVLSVVIPM